MKWACPNHLHCKERGRAALSSKPKALRRSDHMECRVLWGTWHCFPLQSHGREKIQRTLLQSCVYWKWSHSRALKPSSMHRCVLTFSRSPSLHDLCGRLSNGQLLARKRSDLDRTFAKAHGELVEFLWILTLMLDHIDHALQTFRGSKWLKNAQDLFRISQSEFNTV